jgi:hypothetical protein
MIAPVRRALYRVRQFFNALGAYIRPLTAAERAEARAWLPRTAWPLFDAMPRNDQRHSLNVLRSLRTAGHRDPALLQAALLHDVAKSTGGVTLLHRVAVVLLKGVRPDWADRMVRTAPPARDNLRYPFWAHANHPRLGAEMAAAAGCDPLAVTLIRRHQDVSSREKERRLWSKGERPAASKAELQDSTSGQILADRLLIALQTADEDN